MGGTLDATELLFDSSPSSKVYLPPVLVPSRRADLKLFTGLGSPSPQTCFAHEPADEVRRLRLGEPWSTRMGVQSMENYLAFCRATEREGESREERGHEYADSDPPLRHRRGGRPMVLRPRSGRCRALCRLPGSRKPFRQYGCRARFEGAGGPDDMRQCGDARAHRRPSGGAPTQFPCAAVIATDQRAGAVAATCAMGKPMARGRAVGSMNPFG